MADTEATPTLSEAAAQSVLPTYTKAELAALDESDSARAAAIRMQSEWATSVAAEKLMEEDRDKAKLTKHLEALDAIDAQQYRERQAAEKTKADAEEKANADARIAELQDRKAALKTEGSDIDAELKRLAALKREG